MLFAISQKNMRIIFASGGSGGPNAPLIAIYEELKSRDAGFTALWLGTKNGVEKNMIAPYQIPFKRIISGKLKRYFSLLNLFTPLFVLLGFIQSLFILKKFKPDAVLTAGSFVAVPVVYAAWLLGIPRFVHQQDLEIGLANKIMAKVATAITVTFSDSIGQFNFKKTFHVSNPVRKEILKGNKDRAVTLFGLNPNRRTILFVGGGQGAELINQMVLESVGKICAEYQIIHLTGQGKEIASKFIDYYDRQTLKLIQSNYHAYEFLQAEIFDAMAASDLAVSRAGFSILTEFAALAKPVLLIPLPGHQEINAQYFAKYNAAKVIKQENLNSQVIIKVILSLLNNPADLQNLSRNISQMIDKDAAKRYVDLVGQFLKK